VPPLHAASTVNVGQQSEHLVKKCFYGEPQGSGGYNLHKNRVQCMFWPQSLKCEPTFSLNLDMALTISGIIRPMHALRPNVGGLGLDRVLIPMMQNMML